MSALRASPILPQGLDAPPPPLPTSPPLSESLDPPLLEELCISTAG